MTVRQSRLPSGLTVVTHAMDHLESAALGVWVGAGSRSERDDEHGLSHLLEHMAFKGTKTRSAIDIAEEIEAVGGEVNAATSVETTSYYARILKDDVPLAIDILSDILRNSVFDPAELEREQHVIVQEIGAALDTPDDRVYDLFTESRLPGPADRTHDPRHAADGEGGRLADAAANTSTSITAVRRWCSRRPAPSTTTRSSALAEDKFGDIGATPGPEAGAGDLPRRRAARGARPPAGDADHGRLRGPALRIGGLLHGAAPRRDHGRRHVLAALPGSAREARALLLDLRLPLELLRLRPVRRSRRDRARTTSAN